MPITKILKNKIHTSESLKRALIYITNPKKTNDFEWVSGHLVSDPTNRTMTRDEFLMLRNMAVSITGREPENERLAYHIVQSFEPGDQKHLTIEQFHEMGQRLCEKFLGEEYEYVIATHIDQAHIHNHIIFNAVNSKDFHRFHASSKEFAKKLYKISNQIAEEYGASIIPEKLSNSHLNYEVYRQKNSFRREIKERVDFLMRHSLSIQDFVEKAKSLDLDVEWLPSRKYISFFLKNSMQERAIRNRSLGTKKEKEEGKYSKKNIAAQFVQNDRVFDKEEIREAFNNLHQQKEEVTEIQCDIEPWQVDHVTKNYLYLNLEFGIDQKGQIQIPMHQVDSLENGNYRLYLKKFDQFYFIDGHNESSKMMYGVQVIHQLAYDNGEVPIYSSNTLKKIQQLANEIDFLSQKGVGKHYRFEALGDDLTSVFKETQENLKTLDERIIRFNEAAKQTPDPEKLKTVMALTVERKELQGKFDHLLKDFQLFEHIQKANEPKKENQKRL